MLDIEQRKRNVYKAIKEKAGIDVSSYSPEEFKMFVKDFKEKVKLFLADQMIKNEELKNELVEIEERTEELLQSVSVN